MRKQEGLPPKLQKRLLSSFLIVIGMMMLINIGSLGWLGTYYRSLSDKLMQHVEIHAITVELQSISQSVGNYVSSGNSDYVLHIYQHIDNINKKIVFLQSHSPLRSQIYFQLRDVSFMVISLTEQIDQLITDFIVGTPMIYIRDSTNSVNRHIGYIELELSKVNSTYMKSIQSFYSSFNQTMIFIVQLILIISLLLVGISILVARRFTLSVSRPIHLLALTMLQFGKGDLDVTIEPVKSHDEIAVLIDSFNRMRRRIKKLIEGIREKAEIEKQLKMQEIVTQKTQRLLRESELMLLQSQINPHFLFNTLNTISAVAQIEEAPQTDQLICNLSTMLRYNLKNQHEMVTLEQEIVVIRSYMHIQQMRYGDKITYKEQISPEAFGEIVPSMLLQPLIENAIKHGLEPVGRRGSVELIIRRTTEGLIQIIVRDDGKGISQEVLDRIEAYSKSEEGSFGSIPTEQEKPLGLCNVLRRLELCYGKSTFTIKRRTPCGTECMITLPRRAHKVLNDSSVDIHEESSP